MSQETKEQIQDFFVYVAFWALTATWTVHFEGKSKTQILDDVFLRMMYGLISGIAIGAGNLLGKQIFLKMKNKNKTR